MAGNRWRPIPAYLTHSNCGRFWRDPAAILSHHAPRLVSAFLSQQWSNQTPVDSYFESGILKVIVKNLIIFSARMLDIIYELSFYMKLNSIYQDVLVYLMKYWARSTDRAVDVRDKMADAHGKFILYILYFNKKMFLPQIKLSWFMILAFYRNLLAWSNEMVKIIWL